MPTPEDVIDGFEEERELTLRVYRSLRPEDRRALRAALVQDARDGSERTRRFCDARLRVLEAIEEELGR
jgi:hypothetical protein